MKPIDADKLKARLRQTLLDDLELADVLNIIEELEKDPEDMEEQKVRIINADGLKQRIRAIFASENGSKRALPDSPLQITPQTIESWIDAEPTVSEEKDPEDRASEMLDTYARGYNDGVKMITYLMLKFRDAVTDQEEEQ